MESKTFDYEHTYHIRITKTGTGKDTKITGMLSYNTQSYNDTDTESLYLPIEKRIDIDFNPLTILGDLDTLDSIFPFVLTNNENYNQFISKLNSSALQYTYKCIDDLEELRIRENLELKCQVLIEQRNILPTILQKRLSNIEATTFVPLNYEFGKDNKALLKKEYLMSNHQFYYQCYTISEILFAILHFMVIHEYKFGTCALCRKSYVKIPCQGQGKYCSRQNPFASKPYLKSKKVTYQECFDNLDCQNAIYKYNQILRNLKKNRSTYAPTEADEINFYYTEIQNRKKKIHTFDDYISLFNFVRDYDFKQN